jgi:hypothetical protein
MLNLTHSLLHDVFVQQVNHEPVFLICLSKHEDIFVSFLNQSTSLQIPVPSSHDSNIFRQYSIIKLPVNKVTSSVYVCALGS